MTVAFRGGAAPERAAIAEGIQASLDRLLDHCRTEGAGRVTPSDFPLADVDQRALDALFGEDSE